MHRLDAGAGTVENQIKRTETRALARLLCINCPSVQTVPGSGYAALFETELAALDIANDGCMDMGRRAVTQAVPDRTEMAVEAGLVFCRQTLPEDLAFGPQAVHNAAPVAIRPQRPGTRAR